MQCPARTKRRDTDAELFLFFSCQRADTVLYCTAVLLHSCFLCYYPFYFLALRYSYEVCFFSSMVAPVAQSNIIPKVFSDTHA